MATTFGSRPEDVVQDERGVTKPGVVLELYGSHADAYARLSPIATVTTGSDGSWPYTDTAARALVFVRDPNGNVWAINSEESSATNTVDLVCRYTGTQPLRSTVTADTSRRVRWVSSTAPTIGGGYAIDGLDVWEKTP